MEEEGDEVFVKKEKGKGKLDEEDDSIEDFEEVEEGLHSVGKEKE